MKTKGRGSDHPWGMPRRVLLGAVLGAILALPQSGAAGDLIATLATTGQAGVGTVEAVTSGVVVERGGSDVPVRADDALLPGDLIRTGKADRAVLLFGTATRIRLSRGSRLRVDRFESSGAGAFTLLAGAMLYDRSGRGDAPDVQVTAPFGTVAVRGMRFFVGPIDGVYGVLMLRGSARVTAGGGVVNLEPGEGTEVFPAELSPATPRPWSEARIRNALAMVE